MSAAYRSLAMVKGAAGTLVDVLLPPHCASCGAAGSLICHECLPLMERAEGPRCRHCWLSSDAPVCRDCLSTPLAVRELRSAFVYDGPTRAAVLALKHRGIVGLADELVQLSGGVRVAGDIDAIVPIPIPLLRKRSRGGNQAEQLARALAPRARLEVYPQALRRRGWWGPRQAQAASRADRPRIVRDAFIADPDCVAGRGILLVDDVATTMATLREAARTLLASGATAVDAWTVARAD